MTTDMPKPDLYKLEPVGRHILTNGTPGGIDNAGFEASGDPAANRPQRTEVMASSERTSQEGILSYLI